MTVTDTTQRDSTPAERAARARVAVKALRKLGEPIPADLQKLADAATE